MGIFDFFKKLPPADRFPLNLREAEAQRLGNLANTYFREGDFKSAIKNLEAAIKLCNGIKHCEDLSMWTGNFGISYLMTGDFQKAIKYIKAAIVMAREEENVEFETFLIDKLAVALYEGGQKQEAVDILAEGIRVAESRDDHKCISVMSGHLGNMLSCHGAYESAVEPYSRAIAIAKEIRDVKGICCWTGNLGHAYFGMECYQDAITHYKTAIEIATSLGDLDSKTRYSQGLQKAESKLKEKEKKKNETIKPSLVPGGFVFNALAARVSALPTIEDKRQLILSEKDFITSVIKDAIEYSDASLAFSLIDCVKSLIGRELLLRKRCGDGKADFVIHGLNPSQTLSIVANEPDILTITFYYTDDKKFYAFLSFVDTGTPRVEKIVLAGGMSGINLHSVLVGLAEIRKETPLDIQEEKLIELLTYIGRPIIERIIRLHNVKRVLISPFKLRHLLPLHIMFGVKEGNTIFLEQIVEVSYTTSLCNYYMHGKYGKARTSGNKVLSYVDLVGLPNAVVEKHMYEFLSAKLAAKGSNTCIDIVTDSNKIPDYLGAYTSIGWSSHAASDPTSWNNSYLCAGSKKITAFNIIQNWRLDNTRNMFLAACETGIDKTIDDEIDEYFGLDMAMHIAGAETVVSTMWPADDSLATFVALVYAEWVAVHNENAAASIRNIRWDLISGDWKNKVETFYAQLGTEEKRSLGLGLERLLDKNKFAFQDINSWANYRVFGGW